MTWMLLLTLGAGCLWVLLFSLRQKDGIYQYPFLSAAIFVAFVLVQLVGIFNDTTLPTGAIDKTIIMAILCVLMIHLGSNAGNRPFRWFEWDFNYERLLTASLILSLAGAFFFFEISRAPVEEVSQTQWSGTLVAYRFFAQVLSYGLAIAALIYFETGSKFALGIIIFDLLLYADRIFIGARRGDTAELIVIIALAIWFKRRKLVPRPIVVIAITLGTLFFYSTGDYRGMAADTSILEAVRNIQFQENFKEILTNGGLELKNTIYQIESANDYLEFDFGAFHWNTLVFNYVPAQVFGEAFKEGLMLDSSDRTFQVIGHEEAIGSTRTGMADAFRSFWYFGALKFFVIAYVMARCYKAAVIGNSVIQLLYMLMLVNALHSITHHTNWFVSPWVHIAIFLVPCLLFARTSHNQFGLDNANAR